MVGYPMEFNFQDDTWAAFALFTASSWFLFSLFGRVDSLILRVLRRHGAAIKVLDCLNLSRMVVFRICHGHLRHCSDGTVTHGSGQACALLFYPSRFLLFLFSFGMRGRRETGNGMELLSPF
jgi:hypothetical protein